MTNALQSRRVIVVTGDVTMDWNLARSPRAKDGAVTWTWDDCTRACWQRGGAALLADLIEAVVELRRQKDGSEIVIRQTDAPREPVHPADTRFHHSYAMWSLFKYATKSDREKPAWRVQEFLGLDRCSSDESVDVKWKRVVNDAPDADLVVLDDADLGFRDHRELWPQAILDSKQTPWILLKMARPVAQGTLWEHLHRDFADRLVVVTTVDDLRRTEVQISRELSWERTAQDVAWELGHNPRVNALSRCAHVVVSFGSAGAVLFSQPHVQHAAAKAKGSPQCFLFFDPKVIEGMWEQDHPGGMIGYATCMAASLAHQLMLAPDQPDIHRGVHCGLYAMRKLHLEGYGERGLSAAQVRLAFPAKMIAEELTKSAAQFPVVEVQDPVRFLHRASDERDKPTEPGFWTILKDRYPESLEQVAEQIVLEGPESALQGVPLGQFGTLLTVDRRETEAFRSIRALVSEYCRQSPKRALSIAVFGAPGSGKSFGIVQVANSILPGQLQVLEFNLSQLGSVDDLANALHQVRDVGLGGKIPLVFWDEFDTPLAGQRLGWLRYFLAPMQDGKFQEGQISHPIGAAIFVFAGGTCIRMADFGRALNLEEFRAAKGPDFVSRLRGYVNIMGPDRQSPEGDTRLISDPYYVIRRAILLRSILIRNTPQLFQKVEGKELLNIDRGVLRAFLQTRGFKHGVRSMEAIVAMSGLAGKTAFERSSLPSEAQLELHADGRDFLALVQKMDLTGEPLEKLAEAAHEVFCEGLRARGYSQGPQTDAALKTSNALVPYGELPEDLKEQNRGNVRDIVNKLAQVGYVMMPARSNEPPFDFPGGDLECLAEMEHTRWMKAKVQDGWRYAPETDKTRKTHQALLPWHRLSDEERLRLLSPTDAIGTTELPEDEKEKDRDLVRGIPKILAKAGYAIVKMHERVTPE